EAQGVSHEGLVVFGRGFVGDAGGGGQAELDAVEVAQHARPLAVDAAVAFVGDDQVRVAGRIVAVDVHHALQGGDGDPLGVVTAAAGASYVAGQVRQVAVEVVLGLPRQGDPVYQEQHAGR